MTGKNLAEKPGFFSERPVPPASAVFSMSLTFVQKDGLQSGAAGSRIGSWLQNVPWSRTVVLDLVERAVLLVLFGFFVGRMFASFELNANITIPLIVASEILPIVLIVTRRLTGTIAISDNPLDWALGFIGAYTPLATTVGAAGTFIPQELCSVVILSGIMIQISAKVILWRSFGLVAANRGVKVAGPYRIVRHPMYAGYVVAHIGFLMAFPSTWNALIYTASLLIQMVRILREENLLKRDPAYRDYAARVRYRLLPGVF